MRPSTINQLTLELAQRLRSNVHQVDLVPHLARRPTHLVLHTELVLVRIADMTGGMRNYTHFKQDDCDLIVIGTNLARRDMRLATMMVESRIEWIAQMRDAHG